MPISNLALIIAPNLIRNKDPGSHLLEEIKMSNIVFEMIIENYEFLFQNVKKQSAVDPNAPPSEKEKAGSGSPVTNSPPIPSSPNTTPSATPINLSTESGKSSSISDSADAVSLSSSNPKIRRRKSESRVKRDSMHKRVTSSGALLELVNR